MGLFDTDYPRLVLFSLVLATVVALAVAGSTSSAAFGTYNADWDGASTLRAQAETVGAEVTVMRNGTNVNAPSNGTVRVVLSPDTAYTAKEVESLREFVEDGGTLLVAEDFGGQTNPLLAEVGAKARVDGRPLRDEREYYESPAMPVADNVSNHSLARNASALTLNRASVVRPNGATVLVRTSPYAYLDANGSETLDERETLDSYPVATVERVGEGRVVVLGDPSVFINAMLDRSGNRAFVQGVFAAHERVVLDYSHAEQLPPLALALLTLRESALLQLFVGGAGVALFGLWGERPAFVTRARERLARELDDPGHVSSNELVAALQRRHPEWDDERARRVVDGVRDNTEPSPNDADE